MDLGSLVGGSDCDLVLILVNDEVRSFDDDRTLFSLGDGFTITTAGDEGESESEGKGGEGEGEGEGGRIVVVFNVVTPSEKNRCMYFFLMFVREVVKEIKDSRNNNDKMYKVR